MSVPPFRHMPRRWLKARLAARVKDYEWHIAHGHPQLAKKYQIAIDELAAELDERRIFKRKGRQ